MNKENKKEIKTEQNEMQTHIRERTHYNLMVAMLIVSAGAMK